MRYPLPYAFARENLLLLEQDGEALSLHWAGPDDARTEAEETLALQRLSALSEVVNAMTACQRFRQSCVICISCTNTGLASPQFMLTLHGLIRIPPLVVLRRITTGT